MKKKELKSEAKVKVTKAAQRPARSLIRNLYRVSKKTKDATKLESINIADSDVRDMIGALRSLAFG